MEEVDAYDIESEDELLGTDEELTLMDILGNMEQIQVPEAVLKRTAAWGRRLRSEREKMRSRLEKIQKGIKKRGLAVRKLITGHEEYKIVDMIKDQSKRGARRLITGDSNKHVKDFIREPPTIRFIDSVCFTASVILLILGEYFVLRRPHQFVYFYLLSTWLLISVRVYYYWTTADKYFLFDFCYFVNLATTLAVTIFPNRPDVLQACFVWVVGPVSSATWTWRNSLVFHSIDKITSMYIHFCPLLLMFCLRWRAPRLHGGPSVLVDATDPSGSLGWWSWWVVTSIGYSVWQILQLLVTEVIGSDEIERRGLNTALKHITTHPKMPIHAVSIRLMRKMRVMAPDEPYDYNTWKTKLIFVGFQAVYTLLTQLHAKLLFDSYLFFWGYVILIFVLCVWNGARYYIHVFSERYVLQFKGSIDAAPVPTPVTASSHASAPAKASAKGTKRAKERKKVRARKKSKHA